MLGCCADKKFGKGCTAGTCMQLPDGKTCSACKFFGHCVQMYGIKAGNSSCDFFPRRFRQAPTPEKGE
jgi:hypothetical protein